MRSFNDVSDVIWTSYVPPISVVHPVKTDKIIEIGKIALYYAKTRSNDEDLR